MKNVGLINSMAGKLIFSQLARPAFLFFVLLLLLPFIAVAEGSSDSTRRIGKLLPHHVKGQFAGGIGFVSAGFGYSYARDKIESDFYYGYVPSRYAAGEPLHMFTLKNTWLGLNPVKAMGNSAFYPLSLGLLANYTPGEQFLLNMADKYPKGYYGWTTAVHIGIFAGGRITKHLSSGLPGPVSLYYEIGTNDIEVISYFPNAGSIMLWQIFNLGIGLKIGIK